MKKSNPMSRRRFLKNGTTGLAGVTLLSIPSMSGSGNQEQKQKTGKLIYRELGKTGIRIPVVNMGVMNADNPELVKRAYQSGMRLFDTAAVYQRGKNEQIVGQVIKELGIRDKVIIATKVFLPKGYRDITPKRIKEFFLKTAEGSLKRLQMDYVDIFYSHNVSTAEYLHNPGVLEAMQILKDQKKIRFPGFSTHENMAKMINTASQKGFYQVIETAFNYAMSEDTGLKNAFKSAYGKGIGLVAMKTQCQQPWYKEMEPGKNQSYYEGPILHTALLKWALNNPHISCAIPGFTTFQQLEEDITVGYNINYTREEKKFLLSRKVKLAMGAVCRQCGRCRSSCPKNVNVPELIRTHMYASSYANFSEARHALDSISPKNGFSKCRECKSCTARCVNRVNIADRISELKLMFA
jgi:predicted aldo/keto reductase-like oxidoreductase